MGGLTPSERYAALPFEVLRQVGLLSCSHPPQLASLVGSHHPLDHGTSSSGSRRPGAHNRRALSVAYPNLPDISDLADYRPKLPLRVYSAEGALLGEFGEERRNLTPIARFRRS